MTVYLIDGYNVLHQLMGHKPLSRGRQGSAGTADLEDERKRLIDRIASYMGGSSDRAIVVFDSHAQLLQKQESATANVEVYFGSFSRSADSIIEREVYALSAGERVIVVVVRLRAPEDHLSPQRHPAFLAPVCRRLARGNKKDCNFSELHYNESSGGGQGRPRDRGPAQGAARSLQARPEERGGGRPGIDT